MLLKTLPGMKREPSLALLLPSPLLLAPLLLAPVLPAVTGCRPQEEIETYKVEKSPPHGMVAVDRPAGQQNHMLAGIVPQDNKAWFFKLVGPLAAIDRHRDEFLQLLGSLQLNADKNPDWQVPEGWQEKPASGMRAATFAIVDQSGPLELSVTSLPVSGDWDDYVANNVNRWLNQLQQTPLGNQEILKLIKTLPIGKISTDASQEDKTRTVKATWVELAGVMAGMQGADMQGAGMQGADMQGAGKPGAGGMAAGHPPTDSGSQAAGGFPRTSATAPLTYKKPAVWLQGRKSEMRKAAFLITEGENQAEITVIDLPIRGASGISDVAANVRRWAAQVGLQDLNDQQLAKLTHPIEIDGIAGKQTSLLGPKTDGSEASGKGLLAAMIERDEVVWFFKLTGDRSLVESQSETFTDFLKSVKFK